jgi:lysyl-tRNA synthetase class 2
VVFIYDYPACQSALAQLGQDSHGNTVARRFEAYLNGMELANGYCELVDAVELKSRFDADIALRQAAGKSPMTEDQALLAAMESGLPSCAGVALGVDRLLMQLLSIDDISQVIAFSNS